MHGIILSNILSNQEGCYNKGDEAIQRNMPTHEVVYINGRKVIRPKGEKNERT